MKASVAPAARNISAACDEGEVCLPPEECCLQPFSFTKVEARYDKATKRIVTIMMHYTNGDYTSYTISNVQPDATPDVSKFAIVR